MKKIIVMASGNGSNFQAILDACAVGDLPAQVVALISDEPEAYAIVRAEAAKIKTVVLSAKGKSRELYGKELTDHISPFAPDIIVLAGFMRILHESFVERFSDKLINIHPSLLPAFRGLHAIKQAFEFGCKVTGVTVHRVRAEVDSGEILRQRAVTIEADDTLESLEAKIHQVEHEILIEALRDELGK